jgi:N-acyl-D-amino-acid deacylase
MRFSRLLCVALSAVAVSGQTAAPGDALFAAIRRGDAAEVERALKSGISPDAVDADGLPAVMAAALFGDAHLLDVLLARHADPNAKGPGGTTALMLAVTDIAKVRSLLEHGAAVNAKSDTERTALIVAASYPRTTDVLRLLLERGADLRAQDQGGATALSVAIRSADVDVVRFLMDRGLEPKALRPNAQLAGLLRHDLPTSEAMMSRDIPPFADVLAATAAWQPTTLLARWIEAGANVNASVAAQYGRTPLMSAASSEAAGADTLALLLDHGADPNARTTEGESVLDWALYKGDRAKIGLLERRGAVRGTGPRREEVPPPAEGGIADPRVSLTRSVARLLDAAPGFREKTPNKCISCHHNAMPALAAATARRKGIEIDAAKASRNLDDIFTFFGTNVPRMMLGEAAVGGEALTAGYAQLALAANGHPLDRVTATMTHWILARQMPDGQWMGNGLNRPPSEYSSISHTAIAAGGLVAYPLPGRQRDINESLRKARQWLLTAEAKSAEERSMRLMGFVWTKAPRSAVAAAIIAIRDQQDATGGWSQFARTDPDAYATGLSLYALHIAGVPVADAAYRKGIAFLLGSQYQDGAWLVRTHSFPVQRYFESGFPFGRHQWISAAGTSWAALAIAQTLPDRP